MALSDGAHAYVLQIDLLAAGCLSVNARDLKLTADTCRSSEDFSYFTLRKEASSSQPATSLFGIACTRQLDASTLINRPAEVTRSTVQKAIVVISNSPQYFGQLREKLSIVTKAWFAQKYVWYLNWVRLC
jgi:hypothetical protein